MSSTDSTAGTTAPPDASMNQVRTGADASGNAPAPLRTLLDRARLASLPASMRELRVDTDSRPGVRKTLLAFTADRAEIELFCALSPGPSVEAFSDCSAQIDGGPENLSNTGVAARRICDEPDFPWWAPTLGASGRRYAWSTDEIDFVELIVDERRDRVFIRSIE